MKKYLISLGSFALMIPTSLALLSFSPASCGCTDPWEDLAYFANIPANNVEELSASKLRDGINNQLANSKQKYNDGVISEYYGCKEINSNLVVCETDTEYSTVAHRGYRFEYSRSSSGLLEQVKVEPYVKWRIPNLSFKRDA